MSSFMIYRKKEYAVILADSLGYRQFSGGNNAPVIAPKLTHVAPCVFAAHAGTWQPCFDMLSRLHEYLISAPVPRKHNELIAFMTEMGQDRYAYWLKQYNSQIMDLRIPLLLTGPYRHENDIQNNVSSTCLIYETANNFTPKVASGATWAYNGEVTAVMSALLQLEALSYMLNTGPLSLAQALDAIHSLISKICVYVSSDPSIVIVGDVDDYTLVKGSMTTLPMHALRFG